MSEQPRSTTFDFEHKVFEIEGGVFRRSTANHEPIYLVTLGDLDAAVPLDRLRDEFGLKDGCHDDVLLNTVKDGLRYVREIRPGDSVPKELLDGSASWSVDERHVVIAKARLSLQLVTWLTGAETVIVDADQLEQIAEDPTTKQRVNEGLEEISKQLGLDGSHDAKQKAVDKFEALGRELAYIEALRDRFGTVLELRAKLEHMQRLYRRDRSIFEEIHRMVMLFRKPVEYLENIFLQIDAQTSEIVAALKNYDNHVSFIRDTRDDIHENLMKWDELIEIWMDVKLECSYPMEQLLKQTYSMLARNFMEAQNWPLRMSERAIC